MFAKALKWVGLTLGLGVGLAGLLFAAGYSFADWPLAVAMGVTALWVLPTTLSTYSLRRPDPMAPVLLLAAVAITVFAVVDAFFDVIPSDDWGPVVTIMDMALVVAVSFLAVRRPGPAGRLLIGVALVQSVALVVKMVLHQTGALPPGPGLVNPGVVLWMLLVGLLFLAAATAVHTSAAMVTASTHPSAGPVRRAG